MATGVRPRDEETQLTRSDLDAIQDAMKNKKFRELLTEYCEEVRDPANQALFQKEMVQLEKERGYDVTFINPKGGYVIKTSVAGDRKAFINICSNENVGKPTYKVEEMNGRKGMNWQIPYSLIPPREDYDNKKERCVIYDVVYHPDTLRMGEVNKYFRELVNKTAFDGLQKTYNIHLDSNNFRLPKSCYKGMTIPAVIRKEDPYYKPLVEDEGDELSSELMDKLYPQCTYSESKPDPIKETLNEATKPQNTPKDSKKSSEFVHLCDDGYTIPKYVIKQQKNVDFQEFTYHRDSKQHSAIPSHVIVEINLPLLSSTKDCLLDVQEKSLRLSSEKPAKYKLTVTLPYSVNDECGNAKFDKSKRKLIVTLPVIRRNITSSNTNCMKVDSGVESEEYSGSQSDEDSSNLIVELSSTSELPSTLPLTELSMSSTSSEIFLDTSLGFNLPPYTFNVLDDAVAFTFHVKNTEPDSVKVKKDDNKIYIKFTSLGTGFVPVHYAAIIIFDDNVKFDNATGEAWDNNVILQLELSGDVPQKFEIGLNHDSMMSEYFDVSQIKKAPKLHIESRVQPQNENVKPVVEVTNLGTETNIVVSSTHIEYDDEDDIESPTFKDKEIVWIDSGNCATGAKSILRKPITMIRSFSESSADVASSMDYISSDCIPEESSLKKTVRFSDVIARQFYRYNSSIEGQKKKNQRKKSKKRNQERLRSESEAEDDVIFSPQPAKPNVKSVLKQRRDSGLADTSDAETECKTLDQLSYNTTIHNYERDDKNNINNKDPSKSVLNIVDNNDELKDNSEAAVWESDTSTSVNMQDKLKKRANITSNNIKHNTDLYNPDRLNKGQYLDVTFKNDLIFDLDM